MIHDNQCSVLTLVNKMLYTRAMRFYKRLPTRRNADERSFGATSWHGCSEQLRWQFRGGCGVVARQYRDYYRGGACALRRYCRRGLPPELCDSAQLRHDLSSWTGCIAGALTDAEYREGLAAAGFVDIELEVTRRYSVAELPASLLGWAQQLDPERVADLVGRFASTFVRARKPS